MTGRLRQRATAVVVRRGKVLLLSDDAGWFMMPGGRIESGERPKDAAIRELREETGLAATRVTYLCEWENSINKHHVFVVEADGEVEMTPEISSYRWLDRRARVPGQAHSHVEAILAMLENLG